MSIGNFSKNRLLLWISFSLCGFHTSAKQNEKVAVTVNILKDNGKKTQLPYVPDRPLKISDFQAPPNLLSHGVAATHSGIEMGISGREENGMIQVNIDLFAYFDTDLSWMKKSGMNARVLNHEQHHFDLTALQMCKLARTIEHYPFSPQNWNSELKALYRKSTGELEALQQQYDQETAHGTFMEKQALYDRKISASLKAQDCYPVR